MAPDPRNDPRVHIHPSAWMHPETSITLEHDDCEFVAEEGCRIHGRFHLKARRTRVTFRRAATCTGPIVAILAEAGDQIEFGEESSIQSCLIRTSDGHPIYSRRTGERMNPSGNVIIGPSAGICDRAILLRGAHIGRGTIVGAGAVVRGRREPYPDYSIVMGNPARVVARDVEWRPEFGKPYNPPLKT